MPGGESPRGPAAFHTAAPTQANIEQIPINEVVVTLTNLYATEVHKYKVIYKVWSFGWPPKYTELPKLAISKGRPVSV